LTCASVCARSSSSSLACARTGNKRLLHAPPVHDLGRHERAAPSLLQ
jgi:hypothetical protein